jgi:MFS family permease
MVWTLIAEIYPSKYRAKAMALATASNWGWNFLIAFFTPFITSSIDFRYGYIFAACNFVGGLLVYLFVLESQGRTLEEIDTMYGKYFKRVPPFTHMTEFALTFFFFSRTCKSSQVGRLGCTSPARDCQNPEGSRHGSCR